MSPRSRYVLEAEGGVAIEEPGISTRKADAFEEAERLSRAYGVPILVKDTMARKGACEVFRITYRQGRQAGYQEVAFRPF